MQWMFFHLTGRTELSSTKAWGQCSPVIVRILSRSGPKGPSQTNPDKDNIDEPHSEPLTAKAVCENSEGLSVTNESTLEKAYENCKQVNSTLCELIKINKLINFIFQRPFQMLK